MSGLEEKTEDVTNAGKGFWKYEIRKTMVKISNKQMLILEDGCTTLPPCQTISQIMKFQHTNFKFNSRSYGSKYFTCAFLIYGDPENEVYLKPYFLETSTQEIELELLNSRSTYISKGAFVWYILPIRIIKNPFLCLQLLPDKANLELRTSCLQSGTQLATKEPILFLQGFPQSCEKKLLPYILAQKTDQFNKKYAKVHSLPGGETSANSIRVGTNYVKISTNCINPNRDVPLSLTLTLSNEAIIAFKYNPNPKHGKNWDSIAVDIHYFGIPMFLPPEYITEINYNNEYDVPLSRKITAMVLSNCNSGSLYTYPTQWCLNKPLKLLVRNMSSEVIELHHGQRVARAYFLFLANQGNVGTMLRKYIRRTQTTFVLPGDIIAEALDFVSFERIAKSSTLCLNKIK